MMTTIVPWITCDWFGHSTFFSSAQDSWTKRLKPPPGTRREPEPGRLERFSNAAAAQRLRTVYDDLLVQ